MVKQIFLTILFLCLTSIVFSQNIIFDPENDSGFTVNDEFRKSRKQTSFLQQQINAITVYEYKGYINGLECEYVSSTSVKIKSGYADIDGKVYQLSSDSTVSISSLSDGWIYIYVYNSSGNLDVYTSNTYPETSQYRCIMAIYKNSGSILKFYQQDDYVQYDTFVSVSSGSTSDANIPKISILGNFELYAQADGSNQAEVKIRCAGSSGDYINLTTGTVQMMETIVCCFTNSLQQVDCSITTIGSSIATCKTIGYWINCRK